MPTDDLVTCPDCEHRHHGEDPFCSRCGAISPSFASSGSFAVKMSEIPSQKIRTEAVRAIRDWFPSIDSVQAEQRLARGDLNLLRQIDEKSAKRIVEALKAMKVSSEVVPDTADKPESWFKRLLNGGLVVSAVALILAALIQGFVGLLFLLIALGAPVVRALTKQTGTKELVTGGQSDSEVEEWTRLGEEYQRVVKLLGQEHARLLEPIAELVFALYRRLRSGSLTAAVAGDTSGQLYGRLKEVIRAMLDVGGRMASEPSDDVAPYMKDLDALRTAVHDTERVFRDLELGEAKDTQALSEEMEAIAEGVQRVVKEVQSQEPSRTTRTLG